jgi:hypothetical protein
MCISRLHAERLRMFSWDFARYGSKYQNYVSVIMCGLHKGTVTINYRSIITVHQCRAWINDRHTWVPFKSQSMNNYRCWEYVSRDKEYVVFHYYLVRLYDDIGVTVY